jgi:hypothetical protein
LKGEQKSHQNEINSDWNLEIVDANLEIRGNAQEMDAAIQTFYHLQHSSKQSQLPEWHKGFGQIAG